MKPIRIFGSLAFDDVTSDCAGALQRLLDLPKRRGRIQIDIFSNGGDVDIGRALVQAIERAQDRGWTVATHAFGECSSSAIYPLTSGSRGHRTIAAGTDCWLHCVRQECHVQERDEYYRALADGLERENRYLSELLARKSDRAVGFWRKFFDDDRDHHLTPEDLLRYGAVDRVV